MDSGKRVRTKLAGRTKPRSLRKEGSLELMRPLSIPVILGTTRQGRMSAYTARLVTAELSKQAGVETELIDISTLPLPTGDAGEAIQD